MKEYRGTVTLAGKEYDLLFNLNALGEVQEKYSDLDDFVTMLNTLRIKELIWLVTIMINAAIDYDIFFKQKKVKHLTETEVGMLLDISEIGRMKSSVQSTLYHSMPESDERASDIKNATGGQEPEV